jgi:hypothetical protein
MRDAFEIYRRTFLNLPALFLFGFSVMSIVMMPPAMPLMRFVGALCRLIMFGWASSNIGADLVARKAQAGGRGRSNSMS